MATAELWSHVTRWEGHVLRESPGKLAGDYGGPCPCEGLGSVAEYGWPRLRPNGTSQIHDVELKHQSHWRSRVC